MICTWCDSPIMQESKDHVFPRGLGGTLDADLWVYDCERCRASISKAEDEVVHRSHLSVYRFVRGLLLRHKKRPSSGLIEPRISLVKDPTANQYAVFALRTGTSHPRTLPALEVNLASGELYFCESRRTSSFECRINPLAGILWSRTPRCSGLPSTAL